MAVLVFHQAEITVKGLNNEVAVSREKSDSLESQLTETNNYLSSVTAKLEEEVRTGAQHTIIVVC